MQSALLPRWLQRLLMFFAAGAIAVLALWFGIHPSFATSAQASPQPAAATAPQVIVIQPTPAAPSSSPSPKPTPPSTPPAAATSHAAPPPASTSKAPAAPPKPAPPTQLKTTNILNYAANASVDLNEDKFNNGQLVDIWPTNHTPAQAWTIWTYPDGTLIIQSDDKPAEKGIKVLQEDPRANPDGTTISLWDTWNGTTGLQQLTPPTGDQHWVWQQWTLTSIPGNAAYGVLKNKFTKTCLTSKGSQQWLSMASCNTADQNQWFDLFGP